MKRKHHRARMPCRSALKPGTIPGQMKENLKHAHATPRPVARNHGMIRLQGKRDELAHSRNKTEQNVNAEYVSSEVTDGP